MVPLGLTAVGITIAIYTARDAQRNAKAALAQAREAMALAHRPRLAVRHAKLPGITDGNYSDGSIVAINVGDRRARIIGFAATWRLGSELPRVNPFTKHKPDGNRDDLLEPGGMVTFVLPSPDPDGETSISFHRALFDGVDGTPQLHLMGVLDYRDDLGHVRRVWFGRVYDQRTGHFKAVDNVDYERAD